jgi:hypothetical protein
MISFSGGITILKKTYSPNYDSVVLKTSEGATIHKKIKSSEYGAPIEGDYMIVGPKDNKFMLATNVREWYLITFIPLIISIFLMFYITINQKKIDQA